MYYANTRPQQTIAKILAASDRHDLVMATTEAGYLCWQSGWRCIDLRGLNDERIAHEGYPDEKALADPNPDVNVAHVPTSPTASSIHAGSDGFLDGWTMGALSRLARVWVRGRRPADRVERCRSGCG